MLQRIQTVYLFLAAIAAAVLLLNPPMYFASYESSPEQKVYTMDVRHIHEMMYDANNRFVHLPKGDVLDVWGLAALASTVCLLCVVDIFLFKKRILQARFNVITIICAVGYYGMLFMYAWFAVHKLDVDWFLDWPVALPLVIVILLLMATRRILADEALVRSANRLR